MQISVIGAGYVGLTTAACLAEIGHHVLCADNDAEKLKKLDSGRLPFFEPISIRGLSWRRLLLTRW